MDRTRRNTPLVDQVRSTMARRNAKARANRDSMGERTNSRLAGAEHLVRWETEGGALGRFRQPHGDRSGSPVQFTPERD
jgi:hypothetical protein